MAGFDSGNDVKNRIREAADIVQVIGECVELKRAGVRFTGLCPFHGEKTPSFSVNPQGQFFHCFGCGESGDVFSFMMKYHHLTFPEALKDLARRYQIDLPERSLSDADRARIRQREQLYRVNHEAARIYHSFLKESEQAAGARQYLVERGVPRSVIDQYQLGYTPPPETGGWKFIISRLQAEKIPVPAMEQAGLAVKKDNGGHYDRFRDRVLFPIYDLSGREVAFGGRILGEGKPKYMNSPESMIFTKSRLLFGLYQHREAIRKSRRAVVVEGNFDLLLLAVHGIDNVVAPLGTALTRDHIKSLRGYCDEVVLLFDGDSAGLKAARRSIPFFLSEQVEARVALLPEGHDPDSLVREKGPQGIEELVEAATPLPEFVFSALSEEHGLSLSGKNRILAELVELVKEAADPGQRELMVSHFSGLLGVAPARFTADVPRQPPVAARPEQQEREVAPLSRLPAKERQLLDFLVRHPDFLQHLLAGGLRELIVEPQLLTIIDHLERLSATGVPAAEQLLSELSDPLDKKYIIDLLIRVTDDEPDSELRRLERCDELLNWLKTVAQQRNKENLQQQINAAQEAGDDDLLLELVRKKNELVTKK